jgi:hypothetical protein
VAAAAELPRLKRSHRHVVRPGLHDEWIGVTDVAPEATTVPPVGKDDRGNPIQR